MASILNIGVRARDLTRGDLRRIHRNFNDLGRSINRFAGSRTQQNLNNMRAAFRGVNRDISSLRGRIPIDEFNRLSRRAQVLNQQLSRIGTGASATQLGALRRNLRNLDDEFARLNQRASVRVRIDDRSARRDGRNIFARLGRDTADAFTGAFNGNFGASMKSVFTNPILLAVALGAFASLGGIVGAALAAALILAFGAGIVGLGVFIALQADGMKEKWEKALNELKPLFADAAKPMIPAIEQARQQFLKMGKDFAPAFKLAMEEMQGPVRGFLVNFERGIRSFGERAWQPIKDAFNALLLAFGPDWDKFMQGLGDSFGALARTVQNHSVEISAAFRMVLGLITTIIDIVNFLANVWVDMYNTGRAAFAGLLDAAGFLVEGFTQVIDKILAGIVGVGSVIPGIGDKAREAREGFRDFANGAAEDLHRNAQDIRDNVANTIAQSARNKLTIDINSLEAKLRIARADMERTANKKAKAKIEATIAQLERELKRARAQLDALNGKTVTTFVRGGVYFARTAADQDANGVPDYVQARRTGGIIGAATGGVRSNLTMVGEQGPELVRLPAGSQVRSNPDTRRAMSGGGGGGAQPVLVVIELGGKKVGEALIDPLRDSIGTRGGNVQNVLGRGR